MSNNIDAIAIADALKGLKKSELVDLLLTATTPVAQDVEEETKVRCTGIAASTGEQCSRNATTESKEGEARCKSHEEWDNEEAKAKFAQGEKFVADLREKAEKRAKKSTVDNKALAAAMRQRGVKVTSDTWAVAKGAAAEGSSIEEAADLAREKASKDDIITPKAKKAAKKGKGKAKKAEPKTEDLSREDLLKMLVKMVG